MSLDGHPTATLERDIAHEIHLALIESNAPYSKLTQNALLVHLRDTDDPIELSFPKGTKQVSFLIKALEDRLDYYGVGEIQESVRAKRVREAIEELETIK